jgi:chromosome segregation ATPase
MAERVPGKAKKQARKLPGRAAKGKAASAAPRGQLAELEAECQRLRAELGQAAVRLEALEAQRKHLLDRIDWAIDTLHSVLGE